MFHEFRIISRVTRAVLAVLFSLAASVALAASPSSTLSVELSSEASQPAANDLMQATLSAEAVGATLAGLSGQIDQTLAEALKLAKTYPAIKVQSGGTSTTPIYDKEGHRIESWNMRSSLLLESGDAPALSELIGKLQTTLAISSLRLLPSPETARKAEDAAMLEAIALFKARAKLLADAQGKNYRIKELSVSTRGNLSPVRMLRAAAPSGLANAAPMPIESGESMIGVSVSGKIEIE
jgi:predicted secreted protein